MQEEQKTQEGENKQPSELKDDSDSVTAVQPETQKTEMSSISELFKTSLKIYTANFWKYIALIAIPLAGFFVLGAIFLLFFGLSSLSGIGISGAFVVIGIILSIVAFIAIIYLSIISQAGVYILTKNSANNPSVKEVFLEAKKSAVKFFSINVYVAIFFLLWLLLFIIPGFVALVFYTFAPWAFFYEGFEGRSALKRSKELVKNNWWAVFGRLFVVYIGVYIITLIPYLFSPLAALSGGGVAMFSLNAISNIISFVLAPFFIIYTCFIYWDLVKIKGQSKIEKTTEAKGSI